MPDQVFMTFFPIRPMLPNFSFHSISPLNQPVLAVNFNSVYNNVWKFCFLHLAVTVLSA